MSTTCPRGHPPDVLACEFVRRSRRGIQHRFGRLADSGQSHTLVATRGALLDLHLRPSDTEPSGEPALQMLLMLGKVQKTRERVTA